MTELLAGGCHCGRHHVALRTGLSPAGIAPRACDCDFCRKHAAAWVSDPEGELVVTTRDPTALARYRQGSASAEFLLCRECGVLLAVVAGADASRIGAVNARCLDAAEAFAPDQVVSPQRLSAQDKLQRWRQIWTPRVRIEVDDSL